MERSWSYRARRADSDGAEVDGRELLETTGGRAAGWFHAQAIHLLARDFEGNGDLPLELLDHADLDDEDWNHTARLLAP